MIRNHNNPIPQEEDYRKMRDLQEIDADRREQDAWSKLARKARDEWIEKNPY